MICYHKVEYAIKKWKSEHNIDIFHCEDVDGIAGEEIVIRCLNGTTIDNLMWDAMKNRKHITISMKEETEDAQR